MKNINTKVTKNPGPAEIRMAGALLRSGGLVAIPTETVYGLAANALDTEAVRKIFAAKGRPQDNPLIVHIADAAELNGLFLEVTPEITALASRFWPGPLTIVAPRSAAVPDIVSAGLDTVAVRMPAHPVARAVIRAAGVPLAAPSANVSGSPSPTSAEHVLRDLGGRIEAILDGGPCAVGVESTVVDMSTRPFRLLRPGGVTLRELCEVLGVVVTDKAVTEAVSPDEPVRAPGMKYRHYAPRAPLCAVCGPADASARYIRAAVREGSAVLCFDGYENSFGCPAVSYGPHDRADIQARRLFAALRELDGLNPARIFAQCPDDEEMGLAVANRIKKAAGFNVVTV